MKIWFYKFTWLADRDWETALQLAQARAIGGNPLLGSAQGEVNKILQGDYLSPTSNPFLQNVAQQVADNVTSQVQSQFTRAGRLGSGANQEILAKQLADSQNRLFADNFAAERQRQFDRDWETTCSCKL